MLAGAWRGIDNLATSDAVRGSKVEVIAAADATVLARASATSRQLVWPGNAPDARVTVTRVTVTPGGEQPRHGLRNSGSEPFVYVAITTTTVDFRGTYEDAR